MASLPSRLGLDVPVCISVLSQYIYCSSIKMKEMPDSEAGDGEYH